MDGCTDGQARVEESRSEQAPGEEVEDSAMLRAKKKVLSLGRVGRDRPHRLSSSH